MKKSRTSDLTVLSSYFVNHAEAALPNNLEDFICIRLKVGHQRRAESCRAAKSDFCQTTLLLGADPTPQI